MHDIGGKECMWKTEEDEVEEPETEDGHGGEHVEADVRAAGLDGVADEPLLLVTEEREAGEQDDQQA